MSTNITRLKELIGKEMDMGLIYWEEYDFKKTHNHMNIGTYKIEYKKILKEQFDIETPYNKLSEEETAKVLDGFEKKFRVSTELFKLRNTVHQFRAPQLQLWIQLSKKK